jgi:predicted PurR-regulated permease PerM
MHKNLVTFFSLIFLFGVTVIGAGRMLGDIAPAVSSLTATAISVSAGVLPNEYNALAQELSKKEAELKAREGNITAYEQALQEKASSLDEERYTALLIFGGLFGGVLLMLILLNFYLDSKRRGQATLR